MAQLFFFFFEVRKAFYIIMQNWLKIYNYSLRRKDGNMNIA